MRLRRVPNITVSGFVGVLFTLIGAAAFVWTTWVHGPTSLYATSAVLSWLIRLAQLSL